MQYYLLINTSTNTTHIQQINLPKNNKLTNQTSCTNISDLQSLISLLKDNPFIIIQNQNSTQLSKTKASNSKIRSLIKNSQDNLINFIMHYETWCENGITVNFNSPKIQKRCDELSKSDLLIKALGHKTHPTHIIDATAGLGIDSFLLATAEPNAKISLIEQNHLINILLQDGLDHCLTNQNIYNTCSRMKLFKANACDLIKTLPPADIIYLDPMFTNNSFKGAVKKSMQWLHDICPAPSESELNHLFITALKHAKKRVIIKRAKSAPIISLDNKYLPNYQVKGKTIRYDVYLT